MAERTYFDYGPLNPRVSDNLPKKYYNLTLLPKRVVGQDEVHLLDDTRFPLGSSEGDILDAIAEAKNFVGFDSRLRVFVRRQIDPNRKIIGCSLGTRNIVLSTEQALEIAASEAWGSYVPAPARVQLWATAFEEAVHCLRKAAGVSFDNYFKIPDDPTERDCWRYLLQEEEALVDRALNGGLLERRFGSGVFSFLKLVLQPGPFSTVFPNTDFGWRINSSNESQLSPSTKF
jgi:hypothetical protein